VAIFAVMNVVININLAQKAIPYDEVEWMMNRIRQLVIDHPQHRFFLLAANKNEPFTSLKNATVINVLHYNNVFLQSMWYAYRLPVILKKVNASIFVNTEAICSFKTSVPQCLLLPYLPGVGNSYRLQKKNATYYYKAAQIVTTTQHFKNNICAHYKVDEEKVRVIYNSTDGHFIPLDELGKNNCKNNYAEGKEYFLFTGELTAASNLTNLLKAFSFFKKRQKSNMLLLIAATNYSAGSLFEKSLQTYKYKNEVIVLPNLDSAELATITASAYAFVYTPVQDSCYTAVINAMQCEVPVIVSNSLVMHEVCDDAALFTEPAVFENIADKMMLVFKDETLRNTLVTKSRTRAANFGADEGTDSLWQTIEKCVTLKD
jgi:glycosyltransferase involved in cell wall biosynthesis